MQVIIAGEKNWDVYAELASEQIRISQRIILENGTVLLYDDLRGCAYGSDGEVYHPVCREDVRGDLLITGWCCQLDQGLIL